MPKPAIVIVAYNRPKSLVRLLKSIDSARYGESKDIPLVISIDHGNNDEVISIANKFDWKCGEKKIIQHSSHLGLKNHVLQCGDLSSLYGMIILLEDDLVVAADFYCYAWNALNFFKDDSRIAGISLYSYNYCESARLPFVPLDDGFDNFFMQVPSSWGEAWTVEQWKSFREYNMEKLNILKSDPLPEAIKEWPSQSWKKLYYKYLYIESKFFVYPRRSYTTNFADIGSNATTSENLYQVPLPLKITAKNNFSTFEESASTYDCFFELILNQKNRSILPEYIDSDMIVDTYGTKTLGSDHTLCLSTKPCKNPQLQWDISMNPIINNVIYEIEGEILSIAEAKSFVEMDRKQRLILEEKLTALGFMFGKNFMRKDFRYRIGRIISSPVYLFYRLFRNF